MDVEDTPNEEAMLVLLVFVTLNITIINASKVGVVVIFKVCLGLILEDTPSLEARIKSKLSFHPIMASIFKIKLIGNI